MGETQTIKRIKQKEYDDQVSKREDWSRIPHLFGGMSVENSSISVSAKSTAFIPLMHSRLSQYIQLTCVTHLFLKFEVDIVELRSSQVKLQTKRRFLLI